MTQLVRTALREPLGQADRAHPGLLLQRGWTDFVRTDVENEGDGGKTEHLGRVCAIPSDPMYKQALHRWVRATNDRARFRHVAMRIKGRLLIGLTGGGALETGCAVSQTWGMPYLPGSSIKGVVRAYAEQALGADSTAVAEMFGTDATEDPPAGQSGLVGFHDAWWLPDSGPTGSGRNRPFVAEVVTPHHRHYYGSEGDVPATDLDSPVPNAMVGVQGAFLITLEGPAAWLDAAQRLLEQALVSDGIGAKTRAGYGYFSIPEVDLIEPLLKANAAKSAELNFARAKLHFTPGNGELKATLEDNRTTAPLKGTAAKDLLEKLPEEQRNGKKIKEGKLSVEVRVKTKENMTELIDLRPVVDIT